jgi:hypothetical protein
MQLSDNDMNRKIQLLSKDEVKSLRPKDREMYIDKVLLELVRSNTNGVSTSELEEATKFYGRTIRDHLDKLVARGEIIVRTVGRDGRSMFYPAGEIIGKPTEVKSRSELGKSYLIFQVESDRGAKFYVQVRNVDSFGGVNIKGGIYINEEDVLDFVKSIHALASKQGGKQG